MLANTARISRPASCAERRFNCPHRRALGDRLRIAVARHDVPWKNVFAGFAKKLLKVCALSRRLGVKERRQQAEKRRVGSTVSLLNANEGLQQSFDALQPSNLRDRSDESTCVAATSAATLRSPSDGGVSMTHTSKVSARRREILSQR